MAFGISAALHLAVIYFFSTFNGIPHQIAFKEIEVNYLRLKPDGGNVREKTLIDSQLKDDDLTLPGQRLVLSDRNDIPAKRMPVHQNDQEDLFRESKNYFSKPNIPKAVSISKNTVNLSRLEAEYSDKQTQSPAYLTYSNYLHERYRHCLYARYSRIPDNGLVSLKFALNPDGSLAEYQIIGEKSAASEKLKYIAVEALKDASPFPALPKELNSSGLTFRVSIHFTRPHDE